MIQTIETAILDCGLDFLEARLLMQHALQADHTWLSIHRQDSLNEEQIYHFNALANRRLIGEPIAYILGYREFYGFPFKVTPAVLIPRPETELLVETVLSFTSENQLCKILDLGTGSGAIAASIAKHRPQAKIIAIDHSKAALIVAEANAKNLAAANIKFLQSDWFKDIEQQFFDIIVANPPYIEEHDPHLALGDLRFEPEAALTSGADGLDAIRKIISGAGDYLKPGGKLLFEHGYNQAPACRALLKDDGFAEVQSLEDLAGIPRVTRGQKML